MHHPRMLNIYFTNFFLHYSFLNSNLKELFFMYSYCSVCLGMSFFIVILIHFLKLYFFSLSFIGFISIPLYILLSFSYSFLLCFPSSWFVISSPLFLLLSALFLFIILLLIRDFKFRIKDQFGFSFSKDSSNTSQNFFFFANN